MYDVGRRTVGAKGIGGPVRLASSCGCSGHAPLAGTAAATSKRNVEGRAVAMRRVSSTRGEHYTWLGARA